MFPDWFMIFIKMIQIAIGVNLNTISSAKKLQLNVIATNDICNTKLSIDKLSSNNLIFIEGIYEMLSSEK